jgi:Lon protease-like protein
MAVTPQFPLGTVLFPDMVLPLHVFEPRYRAMVAEVLANDGVFGVVLISRGHEVGGGEQRTDLGTTAKVVKAEQLSDGRWAIITVGVERFKVRKWLPDDPYPIADIEPWPDESPAGDIELAYQQLVTKFRRCMALASESGLDVGPQPEPVAAPSAGDIGFGCMRMADMAPVGAHDKQRLLAAPGAAQRVPLLDEMISDALELIEQRLSGS